MSTSSNSGLVALAVSFLLLGGVLGYGAGRRGGQPPAPPEHPEGPWGRPGPGRNAFGGNGPGMAGPGMPGPAPMGLEAVVAGLDRELKLTDEQAARVRGAVAEARDAYKKTLHETRPLFQDIHKQLQTAIRGFLTPEQAAKYDEIQKRREQRTRRSGLRRGGRGSRSEGRRPGLAEDGAEGGGNGRSQEPPPGESQGE